MSSLFGLTQEFTAFEQLSNDLEVNEETGEIIDNTEQLKQLFDELECSFIDNSESTNTYLFISFGVPLIII